MSEQLQVALAGCTLDDKRKLMVQLARELFTANGWETMPLQDDELNAVIGFVTPYRILDLIPTDPAWAAEQRRRIENPGKTYSVKEFLKELKKRLAQRAK